jgi:hypothetical protein
VVVNLDIPTTGFDVIRLAAHEVYPGHHTEHALKEQLLLRDRGAIEEGIQLVPTPQAVLSEGIAELGLDVVLDEDGRFAAYDILERHGIALDRDHVDEIVSALKPLGTVGIDAALMVYEDGASAEDAQRYIERWRLATPEQARHSVRFFMDPTWRAYGITYSAGEELCRSYVGDDPLRFRRLLTEHVRIGELREGR